MSRITKWELEKTKVKVVFRLQFHATQVRFGLNNMLSVLLLLATNLMNFVKSRTDTSKNLLIELHRFLIFFIDLGVCI
jgi:hypothetical protein